MPDTVPPSTSALAEALLLSEDLLRDIELNRTTLALAALKATRLARLLNDFDHQAIFQYEVAGYPLTADGFTAEGWRLAGVAGRHFEEKDKSGIVKQYGYAEGIEVLEQTASSTLGQMGATQEPNGWTRHSARVAANKAAARLAARRGFVHAYVLHTHYQLKFSGVASDAFAPIRKAVDGRIGSTVPSAIQKFAAVHDNLRSDNPEDWSNAVHSCRRILQDLADGLFPPRDDRAPSEGDGQRAIKLGPDNYINRLACYCEDQAGSDRYKDLVR